MVSFKAIGIGSIFTALILLVILFTALGTIIPQVQTAGDNLSGSGAPFASFFGSSGLMVLAIMAAVVLAILSALGLAKGVK